MEKTKKKGGNKKIIIFVLIGLIAVGVAGYFGYTKFFAKPAMPPQSAVAHTVAPVAPAAQATPGAPAVPGTPVAAPTVVSEKAFGLDECLVNLTDEDSKAYLKVKVFIGHDTNKKLDKELEEKKPMIRDAVISTLRAKKSTDITPKNTDSIKMEILARVNPLLHTGQANNIYFYDLLLQK